MFEVLEQLPPDPILGLSQQFQVDPNPDKINLSVGVYQDSAGHTPIFKAVKQAEQQLIEQQRSKAYIAQAGDADFNRNISRLLLGDALVNDLGAQLGAVMTPGGCGALRMGGELLAQVSGEKQVWVSDPTWANHFPLLQSAGLKLTKYPYYDFQTGAVNFDKMLAGLRAAQSGDVVLLHGCCHNPTGADLSEDNWDELIELLVERQLVPFIDVAYQGFGHGLDVDAYGVRQAVKACPEVLIALSCSKNFGLYRERTGALLVITQAAQQTAAAVSHVLAAARRNYSMPPYHGAGIVGHLLNDAQLTSDWQAELSAVRERMNLLRKALSDGLNQAQDKIDFSFVAGSNGMFCYLGIPREMVLQLRAEFGIYLLESTRINVAGLSETNLPVVVERVAELLKRSA
ncbi:MAG: aspartate/tyrosine/aromatic aminotransferase [Gammaproteobacteria bacterium]|nr:aspartate/tyrosine/aromatic aminotransferase [Gammaproteobacteria bacterium]